MIISRKNKKIKKVFYISYDGILDSIGESQILAYLELLSNNYEFILLSFEKKNNLNSAYNKKIYERLKKSNIKWFKLRYYKYPNILSTIYNIIVGFIYTLLILIFNQVKIVHIRSYIPGVIIYPLKFFFNFKLVFDMRGFWADEKSDRAGWSKKSLKYIFFKNIEKKLLFISDSIVCLTNESIEILKNNYPKINQKNIYQVYTASDENQFKPLNLKNNNNSIVIGHVGSVDTAYNIELIFNFFTLLLKINDNIKLIVLNKDKHNYLNSLVKKYKINKKNIEIKFVERSELNYEINKFNICIFFAKNNYSIKASFPTKISEILLSGRPIICNNFNKDVSEMIDLNKVGIVYDFNLSTNQQKIYDKIIKIINDNNINLNCRNYSKKELSLSKAIQVYKNIYYNLFL